MKLKLNLKTKTILSAIGLVAGIALVVCGYMLSKREGFVEILSSVMIFFGLVLAAGCIRFLYNAIFWAEKLRQEEIDEKDERNQLIRGKAAYIILWVSLGVQGSLGAILMGLDGYGKIANILMGASLLEAVCFIVAVAIIEKKM